jgi:hypothetical protein
LLDWITRATELGFISETSASVVSVVNNMDEMASRLLAPKDTIDNDDQFTWSVVVPSDNRFSQSQVEKLLFDTADQVALRHALTTHWSTWHTWNYYNQVEPDASKAKDHIWKEISPFTTCVGMTFQVAKNLQAAFVKTPGLAQYFGKLKTVACPASVDSKQPYHCLAAVFLDQYCVVVDLIFSVKAFKVPYNGSFETLPYISTSGSSQQRRFRYIAGSSGEKMLTMEKVDSNEVAVQFSEIDHHTALQQISFRAARETRETKFGLRVPPKRSLWYGL